jgi:hypothetical protein
MFGSHQNEHLKLFYFPEIYNFFLKSFKNDKLSMTFKYIFFIFYEPLRPAKVMMSSFVSIKMKLSHFKMIQKSPNFMSEIGSADLAFLILLALWSDVVFFSL